MLNPEPARFAVWLCSYSFLSGGAFKHLTHTLGKEKSSPVPRLLKVYAVRSRTRTDAVDFSVMRPCGKDLPIFCKKTLLFSCFMIN
jgi:hypothetical protein